MKEKIAAMAEYLKANIFLLLATIIIVSPIVWKAMDWRYSGQMDNLNQRIELLVKENQDLQTKKEGFKQMVVSGDNSVDFSGIISK
jgi:hypothetical protein